MKKLLFTLIMVSLWVGCSPQIHYSCRKNYDFNKTMEATVGSRIIFKECEATTTHAMNPQNVLSQETQSTELLYGGIANGIIRVTYREYSNNYARPAFYQELQYDLKQSKTLVFRNTTIEVISASNDKIVYKVIVSPEPSEMSGKPIKWTVIEKY